MDVEKLEYKDSDDEAQSVTFRSLTRQDASADEEHPEPVEKVITDGAGDVETSGLRQRRNVDKANDSNEPSDQTEPPKKDANGLVKFEFKRDPLKWFGVLVPSTLRQSQKDFRRAVESSVRLVNYQDELMKIVDEYRKTNAKASEE